MNYRHGFHAGNFADVFKHVLLARILVYLARKETPFRVIDTHAGEGAYDLTADEAQRTEEWRGGVARLMTGDDPTPALRELLAPWRACVGPVDAEGRPYAYPGSPMLAARLMRAQDRAIFCELRPDGFAALRRRFARDERVRALHLDGYTGLGAFVPPKEKRGLVLIDPPFERTNEYEAMFAAFEKAWRKWPTGVYALWHPVKDRARTAAFRAAFAACGVPKALSLSLAVGGDSPGLRETGLVIVNPPFTLRGEAETLLPFLAARMAAGAGAGYGVEQLTEA